MGQWISRCGSIASQGMGTADHAPPRWDHDVPLLFLNGDATFDAGPDGPVDRDAFLAEVPDIVPACVAGIHEFWQNYQKPPPSRGRSKSGGRRPR